MFFNVYYESRKRELKRRLGNECRRDERLKALFVYYESIKRELKTNHKRREGRAENTSPRDDRTETGLRTKPSAEQLQPGAYDLYRTCRLRITGKHLASS